MSTISKFAKQFGPEMGAAILVSLAFPPFNLFLLVFVGLTPLLLRLSQESGRAAFWRGWRFGYLFFVIQLIWLGQFVYRWTQLSWLAMVVVLVAPLVLAWVFGLAALGVSRAWQLQRPWIIPLLWLLGEFVIGRMGALAFPWSPLGLPLANQVELAQWAAYGQVGLLSAWACLGSVTLVLINQKAPPRIAGRYLTVFLVMLMGSFALMMRDAGGRVTYVAAAQPGVDMAFGNPETQLADLRRASSDLYKEAKILGVDLVIFPERVAEGATPPFETDPSVPVLFGGTRTDEEGRTYQSAYATAPEPQVADKTQLVIFGEYVPFRQFLPASFRLPSGDLTPGREIKVVNVGGVKVGPQLCFEALFPHIGFAQTQRGSQLAAVMAIDDWYVGSAAPPQLELASRLRAIESGTPLVRAASSGRSLIFDQFGRTLAAADHGKKELITARVRIPPRSPLPDARGWWPAFALVFSLMGLLVRSPRATPSEHSSTPAQ